MVSNAIRRWDDFFTCMYMHTHTYVHALVHKLIRTYILTYIKRNICTYVRVYLQRTLLAIDLMVAPPPMLFLFLLVMLHSLVYKSTLVQHAFVRFLYTCTVS